MKKELIPFTPQGLERPVALVSPNCSQLVLDVINNSWDKSSSGLGDHYYVNSETITDPDELQEYWEEYSVQLDAEYQILTLSLPTNEVGQLLIMLATMTTPAVTLRKEIEQDSVYFDYFENKSIEFFQELVDYGIESLEQFKDSYQGQHDSSAEFAESLCEDCGYLQESNLPMFIQMHIDWELVWSNELRFDYFEVDGHFFSNNF